MSLEIESPVVETSAVSTEQPEPGQASEAKIDESAKSTSEAQATTEKGSEDQTATTNQDEVSKDGNANPDEDTSKWIGKRLERAKAAERAKVQAELEYWKNAAMGNTKAEPEKNQPTVTQSKPVLANYNDIESYTEALTDWKIGQRLTEQNQQSQVRKVQETYQTRAAEFAKTVTDFGPVVQGFLESYKDVEVPELPTIVYESEVGPALVHYLAKNDHEMERIIDLPSHRRIIELGKLEDKLKTGKSVQPPKASKAPAPIVPEKGATPGTKDLSDPNLTQAEYREMRMKQVKGRF